jgi:hypothetical protein
MITMAQKATGGTLQDQDGRAVIRFFSERGVTGKDDLVSMHIKGEWARFGFADGSYIVVTGPDWKAGPAT